MTYRIEYTTCPHDEIDYIDNIHTFEYIMLKYNELIHNSKVSSIKITKIDVIHEWKKHEGETKKPEEGID